MSEILQPDKGGNYIDDTINDLPVNKLLHCPHFRELVNMLTWSNKLMGKNKLDTFKLGKLSQVTT